MNDDSAAVLERLYASSDSEITFNEVCRVLDVRLSDAALAEAIEADGRRRILRGLPVSLDRYFSAVSDLSDRADALDAAIDVTLRSLSGSSRVRPAVVAALIGEWPHLADAIRECATLTNAMWSTNGLHEMLSSSPPALETPCDFGPATPDGSARYELRELLGSGASGEVYLAADRQLSDEGHDALVAVKILRGRDQSDAAKLRRSDEATKARRIDHPNVVRVIDRGIETAGREFIVYEYADGGDLSDWLIRNPAPLDPQTAVAIMEHIARGVQAAHSKGLVHCDLKPGNIIITASGEPKISDFGVAVGVESQGYSPSESDAPIGNLAFISPEQYRMEESALTPPSDIYALGGILFYLLTGVLPNGSTVAEIDAIHAAVGGRTQPPAFPEGGPAVARDLRLVCQRAMAPDPAARYSSAGELADDLRRWLRAEPIAWMRPSVAHRAHLWMRRKPALAIALAGLVVVAAGGGAAGLWANHVATKQEQSRQTASAMGKRVFDAGTSLNAASRTSIEAIAGDFLATGAGTRTPTEGRQRWEGRLRSTERRLERAEAARQAHHSDMLVTRAALAGWLVGDDQVERAQTHIDQFLQHAPMSGLADDDRTILNVRALNDANHMRRLAHREMLSPQDLAWLRETIPALRAAADARGEEDLAAPVQFVFLDSIRHGYEALGEDRNAARIAAELEVLDSFSPMFPHVFRDNMTAFLKQWQQSD